MHYRGQAQQAENHGRERGNRPSAPVARPEREARAPVDSACEPWSWTPLYSPDFAGLLYVISAFVLTPFSTPFR
jgi:hypothetical protein